MTITLTNSLKHLLKWLYNVNNSETPLINIEDTRNCSVALKVNINKDIIEIPLIGSDYFKKNMNKLKHSLELGNKEINCILPLNISSLTYVRGTFNSVLYTLFKGNNRYTYNLYKVISKGNLFYGNRGIIFDLNFNPILMFTIKVERISDNNTYFYKFKGYHCYINPKIFLEDNIIYKGIIKKIIPYFIINGVHHYNIFDFYDNISNNLEKVTFHIDNMDKFIIKPVEQDIDNINESINNFLNNNIEEVMANL